MNNDALYLTRLEVENLRCFREKQTLELCGDDGEWAPWTLIVGENGTGKTTLLRLLAPIEHGNDAPFFLPEGSGPVTLSLSNGAYVTATRKLTGFHGGSFKPVPLYGYGANRQPGSVSAEDTADTVQTSTLFRPDAPLVDPEKWLLSLDYRALRNPTGRNHDLLEQAKAILVDLLPDVSGVHINPPDDALAGDLRGAIQVDTPYGRVRLNDLSVGYQTMLAWVIDLAARMVHFYKDSPDPLAQPAIVLVDEVDLHLHPKWQQGVVDFLLQRFPATQFICTAHSPLLVQASAGHNLALLQREGDSVRIENDPLVLQEWSVDQLLSSPLFGSVGQLPPALRDAETRRVELQRMDTRSPAQEKELQELRDRIAGIPTDRESAELLLQHMAAKVGL